MADNKAKFWNFRRTPEREELLEELRAKLKTSGREVDISGGAVTTASVFDVALRELKQSLDKEQKAKK